MTQTDWLRSSYQAFVSTINIVALTVVIVAYTLTLDSWLLGFGGLIEISFLVWSVFSHRYPAQIGDAIKLRLNRTLLVVSVVGVVVTLFFGFGKHLLSNQWSWDLTHAEGWEAGAIVWTILFVAYYVVKFKTTGRRLIDKLIILSYVLVVILAYFALRTMETPRIHIVYVCAIGFDLLLIDYLLGKHHPDDDEKIRSKASFLLADIPMAVALPVLGLYLWAHRDTEHPEAFVAGIISFQLLVSNATFVVMEFKLLQPRDLVSKRQATTSMPEEERVPAEPDS